MKEINPQPYTNALVQETSPYLLQHAHNPVNWYPWGEEALKRARDEDRPIFLSIGYSACHWCHVMEHESFENAQIARVMNDRFVNIKVDREERPDLDEIYMQAVIAMTGSGGWPMSVFLTPQLEPFYGGTYFPPDDRYGRPGFSRVLVSVADSYKNRREECRGHARKLRDYLEQAMSFPSGEKSPGEDLLDSAYARLSEQFDHTNGGFGSAPKFPGSMSLAFFLRHFSRTGNRSALEMVTQACRKMAMGGIYDQLGGGFHRYSVDERWLVPHFEKMLYDNALLSQLYLETFQATGEPLFRRIVVETLDYVVREMTHPNGGFYSTQDADSEGEEGRFFVWTPEEVETVLGEAEGEVFCRYFDVTPHGNFEHGKSILNVSTPVEGVARLFKLEPGRVAEIVDGGRRRLFDMRETRAKPGRDEKIQTSWNGLMISSFARAYAVLRNEDYRIAAEASARFILEQLWKDGRLLHVWKDGRARFNGYLDDYAFLISALIDLYEATFDLTWLREAIEIAGVMVDQFWDDGGGGFFYTGRDHEKLLIRSRNSYDNAIPSGSSTATFALLKLSVLTGRSGYRERAERVVRSFRDSMAGAPGGFAHLLCALDFHLSAPREIAIVGKRGAAETEGLLEAVHGRFIPNKVLCLTDPESPQEGAHLIPLLRGRGMKEGRSTAFVCRNSVCSLPVNEVPDLERLLTG